MSRTRKKFNSRLQRKGGKALNELFFLRTFSDEGKKIQELGKMFFSPVTLEHEKET